MIPYESAGSGISHYEIHETGIRVTFKTGKSYNYTDGSCGEQHIINMIWHATNDRGLCEYISVYRPEHQK